jgi:hypothetical protein
MQRWKLMTVMALLVGMPGCVRWKQVPVPIPPAPPNIISNMSRVRLNNGQSVGFLTLVVATDSIFGIRSNLARTRLTVSFDQVSRIEVREKDPIRTFALLGVIGFGLWYSGGLGVGPNR